jgi:VIT1/CCC1 family predicted Fe2+/Mn2+ transporter
MIQETKGQLAVRRASSSSDLVVLAMTFMTFVAIIVSPAAWRIPLTVIAVVISLIAVGLVSAHVGNASKVRAVLRVVLGGVVAMLATYGVGILFGATIA